MYASNNASALQQLTVAILDDATRLAAERPKADVPGWSVQGFGVLRLYIRNVARLHIWTRALAFENVSVVHNHSWNLKSTIVCGELRNTMFTEWGSNPGHKEFSQYNHIRLLTGYDSKVLTEPNEVTLREYPGKVYGPGDSYQQAAVEIHRTDALDGTVTLMERKEDVEGKADVYWPVGTEWGTAKPRIARGEEVLAGIEQAMKWLGR